ncbi:MAG: hypothetical protein JSR85_03760 [Proteobacteria bacterium]|nr:hypothetical protein [Pseudomonadota bacterium]
MKFGKILSMGMLVLGVSSIKTMAITCPNASEIPQSVKCIGSGTNYKCTYVSELWHGEIESPVDLNKTSEVVKLLGHYQGDNNCRYSIQTSPTETVNYVITFKHPN